MYLWKIDFYNLREIHTASFASNVHYYYSANFYALKIMVKHAVKYAVNVVKTNV